MPHRKKERGFSHKIIMGVFAITIILFVFTLLVVWKTNDSTPLAYLIPSVFGLTATGLGFYLKKSEHENVAKINQEYIPNYEYMTDYEREVAINEQNFNRSG